MFASRRVCPVSGRGVLAVHPTKTLIVREGGPLASRALGGGPDHADLVERLERQDAEIASLCAEVLERYEEATFVYRLSERIGSALGERAIAGLVVREAAAVLGAHGAELWVKAGPDLVLAAALEGAHTAEPTLAVQQTRAPGRTWGS